MASVSEAPAQSPNLGRGEQSDSKSNGLRSVAGRDFGEGLPDANLVQAAGGLLQDVACYVSTGWTPLSRRRKQPTGSVMKPFIPARITTSGNWSKLAA